MKFKFNHNNFNVLDLEKSIAFYEEALGLKVVNEFKAPDGSFILAYMGDYEAAHKKHEEMGCICFENPAMGIYFINDPDGYWIEIIPGGE